MGYTISVSFIEFLRKFCVYDGSIDKVLRMLRRKSYILNLKGLKLAQILRADKRKTKKETIVFCHSLILLPPTFQTLS